MSLKSVVNDFVSLMGRLFVGALGFGIAVWGCYDIIVNDRKNPVPPPVAHYIIVGIIIVVGLGLAGGKHTLKVFTSLTNWTRAWRGLPPLPVPPAAPPGPVL